MQNTVVTSVNLGEKATRGTGVQRDPHIMMLGARAEKPTPES